MNSVLDSLENRKIDTSVPVVVIAPGYHSHGIARSLGRLGVPVYGVHADSRSPAARSRYWRGNFSRGTATGAPRGAGCPPARTGRGKRTRGAGANPNSGPTRDPQRTVWAAHTERR